MFQKVRLQKNCIQITGERVESPGPKFELPVNAIAQGKFKELEMFRKLAGLTAIAGLFFAGSVFAAVAGSAHDFSGAGYTGSNGEICIVCHTPHDGDTNVAGEAPLWNHEMTVDGGTAFVMYSNPGSIDGTVATVPNTVSKLCLSCHDGSVAVDSFGGLTGTDFLVDGTDIGYVGRDLSAEHPISITYDVADLGLNPTGTTVPALGGQSIDAAMLFGGSVECASCHSVHNDLGLAQGAGLLRMSNAASALCTTCHAK